MPRTVLRCHNCGSRADVELSESEAEALRRQGYVNRACRECAGVSHWEPHETGEASHSVAAALTESPGLILIIDDDESLLAVLSKALARMKFDVYTAYSARSALTLLARHDFDVVLSDIRMPEFDGKQLLAFLDEHMPDAKERVVFITADVGNPETMEFLGRVRRPYVGKPLDIPALLETIRPFLPHPEAIRGRDELPAAVVEPSAGTASAPEPVPHSQTEQALSYAILVLRQEVDALKRTLEERNAEVEALRKELARRESQGRPPEGEPQRELESLRAEVAQEQKKSAAAREEAAAARKEAEQNRQELTRLQRELDDALARLAGAESAERNRGQATEELTRRQAQLHDQLEAAAHERDRFRAEAEDAKQQAAEADAAAEAARQELEYVRAQQEQLASDAQRARDAAAEADADRERLERELSVFRGKESVAGELHGQIAALEAELAQSRDEIGSLRHELEGHPAVPLTPEAVAAAGEVSPEAHAALEREAKRGGARWEAIQTELENARSRAHRLENILRHFYVAAVNPLTVVVATADLASSSQWLSPRDRENLQLLKQNIDVIIETVKVLKKQMQELEIDIR